VSAHPLQWSVFTLGSEAREKKKAVEVPPALVVSRESANVALPVVTVLPLTWMKSGRRIYPNEMILPSGITGLDRAAVLMAHQIRTIPKSWLSTRAGSVDDPALRSAVRAAVRIQLDLEKVCEDGAVEPARIERER